MKSCLVIVLVGIVLLPLALAQMFVVVSAVRRLLMILGRMVIFGRRVACHLLLVFCKALVVLVRFCIRVF